MMRTAAFAALFAATSAEPMVAGGTLKITWSDCGSVHGKATSIEPQAMILGQATNMVGKGSVDEAVSGGGYEMTVTAGIIKLVDHKGDFCNPDSISLPGGLGTIAWKGVSCPVAAGPMEIDMTVTLSANIPASLATTTIKLTGTATNGDNLVCVQINTSPAEEVPVPAVEAPMNCKSSSWDFCCAVGTPCDCSKGTTAPGQCKPASYLFCCGVGTKCDCSVPPLEGEHALDVQDTCSLYEVSGSACGQSDLDCKYVQYAKAAEKGLQDGTCSSVGYTVKGSTVTKHYPVIGDIVITQYTKPALDVQDVVV